MAEQTQRIRIGLTGLALVFLLVLLGAAITNWGGGQPSVPTDEANLIMNEPNEPLAEIGAAPGPSSASTNATTNKQ